MILGKDMRGGFIFILAVTLCLLIRGCSAQDSDGLTPEERAMVYGRAGYDTVIAPDSPINQENVNRFYSQRCSSRGVPLVNGSIASVIFLLSLAILSISIMAVLYNCCFNSFKRSVINSRW
ncbi:Envelope glycoprotein N [Cacatuid alphaherpesvirus 2]|uniref:Envelope glycoprotein N n=1 Tax=Cacatuid alphaherpesvirus 2 TaxID=2604840 RepID=A0A5B9R040_9ALPH|nr:Envelope glycoprotein N [Cacatuid alphaherpesvirus 2]QEG54111.1 Envelope glycoprotein N [Cacatuid alphaherpesvirus 2]